MSIFFGNALWLNLAINAVLPMIVALVTARVAHPGLKAIALLLLSTVSGVLVSVLDSGGAFDLRQVGLAILSGFVVAVATHFGLLKPMSITGSGGAIQSSVSGGVGGSR